MMRKSTQLISALSLIFALSACSERPELGHFTPDDAKDEFSQAAQLLGCLPHREGERSRALGEFQSSADRRAQMCEDLALLDQIKAEGTKAKIEESFRAFLNNFKAGDDYSALEMANFTKALDNLSQNEEFQRNLIERKNQDSFIAKTIEDAREQVNLRCQTYQIITNELRAAFGLEPNVAVQTEMNKQPIGGYYVPGKRTIYLNNNDVLDIFMDFKQALPVVIEEALHSIDLDLAGELKSGRMQPNDVRAEHAAVIGLNSENYAPGIPDGLLNTMRYRDSRAEILKAYVSQYMERSAKEVVGPAAEELSARIWAIKARPRIMELS